MEERLERERKLQNGWNPPSFDLVIKRAVKEALAAEGGSHSQYDDGDVKVEIRNGYHRDGDVWTSDIILVDRQSGKEHLHLVIDEQGKTVHEKWTANRPPKDR
jgi:hypothetical protein